MKKVIMMVAAMLLFNTADSQAQGFLKKMRQKALATVGVKETKDKQNADNNDQTDNNDADDTAPTSFAVAQGSDIVPMRKTSTVTWDGVVTPSSASTSSTLLRELPSLPSAEKMARSTIEESEAYTQQIAAVVARAEQLRKESGCSDAEIEAIRKKWEDKIQSHLGITKEEMAIMQDEKATDAQKKPIQDKIKTKILGGDTDMSELEKLEKMSKKEQEAYIMAHPEVIQKMQKMSANARNFNRQTSQMTGALNSFEMKFGKLVERHNRFIKQENNQNYPAIADKYNNKLQKLYDEICSIDDAAKIDALYDEADQLLYTYRLEAAKTYRASLERRINEIQKFAAEIEKLMQELVASGDLPKCALGVSDMNMVIEVANLLDDAYKELPQLKAYPVCMQTVSQLKEGWQFCSWECRGYAGAGVSDFSASSVSWPLLAQRSNGGDNTEYGVLEAGKFRVISETELRDINKQTDQRIKQLGNSAQKPPYGTYKSRSGKRTVFYSKTGELIINGMTSFAPAAFQPSTDHLEWIVFQDNKIVKCTYKL